MRFFIEIPCDLTQGRLFDDPILGARLDHFEKRAASSASRIFPAVFIPCQTLELKTGNEASNFSKKVANSGSSVSILTGKTLSLLAEETIVMWAKDNLHFTGLTEIVLIPEEKRNAENPQIYMVAPSAALMQKLDGTTAHEAPPVARRGRGADFTSVT